MLGPAATWGAGVPMAGQAAAGASPGESYDAATPSLVNAAALGFMDPRTNHDMGLQSGGLVGYSTFFTGYDPQTDSMARKLSLGRAAAQGVSMTARALMHTGLQETQAAQYIEPFTQAHRYGIGGAASAVRASGFEEAQDVYGATASGSGAGQLGRAQQLSHARNAGAVSGFGQRLAGSASSYSSRSVMSGMGRSVLRGNAELGMGRQTLRHQGRTAVSTLQSNKGAAAADALSDAKLVRGGGDDIAEATADASQGFRRQKTRGGIFKFLTGVLGGKGYNKFGNYSGEVAEETINDSRYLFRDAARGSGGAMLMKGPVGSAIGTGIKGLSYVELAKMGFEAGAWAVGEAYEDMVDTTTQLRRRVGSEESMSAGYWNRAAATERQRAVRALNENRLNPRTQIMGNEARYYA